MSTIMVALLPSLVGDSLNTLHRYPQGSAWNDSQDYSDEVDATHPFHFQFVVPSNVLQLNAGKLSFFLLPFRTTVSAASSSSSSPATTTSAGAHNHGIPLTSTAVENALHTHNEAETGNVTAGENQTHQHTGGAPSTTSNDTGHTHNVQVSVSTSTTLTYGIFESTSPANVTVTVNGVDRTAVLGGAFNGDQLELDVTPWLVVGQKNVIDLGSTQLGRIVAHVRLTGYIQSN